MITEDFLKEIAQLLQDAERIIRENPQGVEGVKKKTQGKVGGMVDVKNDDSIPTTDAMAALPRGLDYTVFNNGVSEALKDEDIIPVGPPIALPPREARDDEYYRTFIENGLWKEYYAIKNESPFVKMAEDSSVVKSWYWEEIGLMEKNMNNLFVRELFSKEASVRKFERPRDEAIHMTIFALQEKGIDLAQFYRDHKDDEELFPYPRLDLLEHYGKSISKIRA